MATRVQATLVDDLDNTPATQTLQFTIDGVSYEIDLNDDHATQLRGTLAPWTTAARRVGGRRTRPTTTGPSHAGLDLAQVRAWARDHGYQVADKGRIPSEVITAYTNAH